MISYTYSQEKSVISNLEDLTLNVGEIFKPESKVVNSDGSQGECVRVFYYNKKGVFSSAKAISFDRSEGTLEANEPGTHEVVAICIDSEGKRSSKTFYVDVNYPKIKEVKLSLNDENIYVGNYIPLVYEITDELDTKRVIDFWTTDVAARYFSKVDMLLTSSNNKIEIDESNNILALEEGSSSIIALFDGVKGEIDIKVEKNPVARLVLKSSENNVRSGDVINYNTVAYDKKGNVIEGIKVDYSFTGKSSDKSNTASGLILNDGRFVGDIPGKYIISAKVGNISTSKVSPNFIYVRNFWI